MNQINSTKLLNDICLISKQNVCLLDMAQVAEKALQLGMTTLAELITSDLNENKIINGQYFSIISNLYGVQS